MTSPHTAWRNEREWFKRTIISCLCSFLALAVHFGTSFWVSSRSVACVVINGKLTESGLRELDELHRYQMIVISMGIFFIVSSFVFLVFLIRWLLAIRTRRRCLVEGGDLISK